MNRLAMGVVIAALLAVVGCSVPPVRPSNVVFDELMHKSGLWDYLAQMEPAMQLDASRTLALMDSTGRVDASTLHKAIADNYAADRLRISAGDQLRATLSSEDATLALQWLSSDLGLRIASLEEVSIKDPAAASRMLESGPRVLASVEATRKQRLERLTKAIDEAEATATVAIDTSIGFLRGIRTKNPGANPASIDDLKASMQSQKERLVAELEPQIVAEYAARYEQLSDDELEQYVAFLESPAGHRFNSAGMRAINTAMTEASVRFGQQMAGAIFTHGTPSGITTSPLVGS